MIKYDLNPFNLILDVVNKLYPTFDIRISFVPDEKFKKLMQRWGANAKDTNDACGVTVFDDRGKPPLIFINAEIPCWASVEIISHEVAHVAAGVNAGHGKIWQAEFDKIYDAYCSAHKAIESEL